MDNILDFVRDAVNGLGGLMYRNTQDVLNFFKVPTPVKITFTTTADASGNIGGGFANPAPLPIYQCPMSHEAWIHRFAVTSPGSPPKTPLTTGQLMVVGGAYDPMIFLPVGGVVAPVLITEGRASAFHMNSGSFLRIYGDSFTAGTVLRFDIQIVLVQGVSEYTPKRHPSEQIPVLE